MKSHTHRAVSRLQAWGGWTQCVDQNRCAAHPHRQDAHMGIVTIDKCLCGATRETESNGKSKNRGPWIEAR
jgi:hypothetical protein